MTSDQKSQEQNFEKALKEHLEEMLGDEKEMEVYRRDCIRTGRWVRRYCESEKTQLEADFDQLKNDLQVTSKELEDTKRREDNALAAENLWRMHCNHKQEALNELREELKDKVNDLRTRLVRTVSAAYHALLETTAWMGIPESKREKHIEGAMGNVRACANIDFREHDKHQTEIKNDIVNELLEMNIERLANEEMEKRSSPEARGAAYAAFKLGAKFISDGLLSDLSKLQTEIADLDSSYRKAMKSREEQAKTIEKLKSESVDAIARAQSAERLFHRSQIDLAAEKREKESAREECAQWHAKAIDSLTQLSILRQDIDSQFQAKDELLAAQRIAFVNIGDRMAESLIFMKEFVLSENVMAVHLVSEWNALKNAHLWASDGDTDNE